MAFAWIYESSLENTTTPFGWDTETDTGGKLDVLSYWELARVPGWAMPYRGASCLAIDLRSGQTADATLTEGDIDIADGSTGYFRFYLWFSKDFAATADDVFNLFELQQAAGTVELSMGVKITATTGAIQLGIGDGTATTDYMTSDLSKGEWHCIELTALVKTDSTGTFTLYVDGASVVALTSLDQAAGVGQGVLGTQDTLATTTGTILIDQFIMDDARVYGHRQRWPKVVTLTQSGHVFVGPGVVDSVELSSGNGTDCVLTLYDTDTGDATDAEGYALRVNNTAAYELVPSGDISNRDFVRGCYAVLAGTTPRAAVNILTATAYGSDAQIRRQGLYRKDPVLGK